jgi:ethanolamine ammonia-lyase small subunit
MDEARLDSRLQRVQSRIPRLRKREKMTRPELGDELRETLEALTDETVAAELIGQLPTDDLVGLALRIRAVLFPLVEQLEGTRG